MLFNKSSKTRIIDGVKLADSYWGKFRGLMFEKKANFNYALVFDLNQETRIGASIHMLFVFFPIDVIYLDSNKKIVDIAMNLKPWSLNYTPKRAAKYFVELPVGKSSGIKIGDLLEWVAGQ